MCLYYVYNTDKNYRLVVYATCRWNARYKASEYMRKEYDIDIPIYEWSVELCDNN